MRRLILAASLALIAAPLAAVPDNADAASCGSRKTTGTVIGGLGGALLGGAVTHGAVGPIVGGVGGAVVGHEIGKNGCRTRATSYRAPARAPARTVYAPAPQPVQPVYYDQYGHRVAPAATRVASAPYAAAPADCRTELHRYYDDRGGLVERQVQVCAR